MAILSTTEKVSQKPQIESKYRQLAGVILKKIQVEKLKAGDKIPTETNLMSEHQVSRVTVRKALQVLEKEGILRRKIGSGTFISEQAGLDKLNASKLALIAYSRDTCEPRSELAFSIMISTLEETLSNLGYHVQLLGCDDKDFARNRLAEISQNDDLAGLCLVGDVGGVNIYPTEIPVVQCGWRATDGCSAWAGVDFIAAGHESTQYLIENYHTKIAVLAHDKFSIDNLGHYIEGCKKAFSEANLDFNRSLLFQALPGENLENLADIVLEHPLKPTGIMMIGPEICMAVLNRLGKKHLKYPEDISLMGYGMNVKSIHLPTPIDTYIPNYELIAKSAAEMLAKLYRDPGNKGGIIEIKGKLEKGNSVRQLDPSPAKYRQGQVPIKT